MQHYERPAILATYTVAELTEAAVCIGRGRATSAARVRYTLDCPEAPLEQSGSVSLCTASTTGAALLCAVTLADAACRLSVSNTAPRLRHWYCAGTVAMVHYYSSTCWSP